MEGYETTRAVNFMSQQNGIETHIFNGVYQVIFEGEDPRKVIEKLMALPFRFEDN